MKAVTGLPATWSGANFGQGFTRSPLVVVLAGLNSSEIVKAALADTALMEATMLRLEPGRAPPCDTLLWRLEVAGEPLNRPGLLDQHWHRDPYAMTLRLVQYHPGSMVPQILDEGTLSTRGTWAAFKVSVDRLMMRFVRDAALGRARGPANTSPTGALRGVPGWLDAMCEVWRGRFMAERWSTGSTAAPIDDVLSGTGLGEINWHRIQESQPGLAVASLSLGSKQRRRRELPPTNSAIAIARMPGGSVGPAVEAVVPGNAARHPQPNLFSDGDAVYCLPSTTERGATRIHRLDEHGRLISICEPAPYARLANSTLFRSNGLYWIACTDLDLGKHDNLCLLHASAVTGPWTRHARWPVKIDVRAACPAGMFFHAGDRLFRPGQDCAAANNAGIVIHEILMLSATDFQEVPVTLLRPDRAGPFPHGLNNLVHDGERFWLDGKRFVFDLGRFCRTLARGAFRSRPAWRGRLFDRSTQL